MSVTIRTNRHWREFSDRYDVPPAVLKDQFDYQLDGFVCWHCDERSETSGHCHQCGADQEPYSDTTDGFFCYLGFWYHLDQFMRSDQFEDWHGFAADSFFSGVAIRLSDDGERYQVATVLA